MHILTQVTFLWKLWFAFILGMHNTYHNIYQPVLDFVFKFIV